MTQEEHQELKQVAKLYKNGQSKSQGGFFMSPHADEAEKLFNEAMRIIRGISVPTSESVEWQLKLLEGLAKVRYDMKFYLDAAKSLAEAYRVAIDSEKKFNKKYPKIPQYSKEASAYYIMNKNYETAADILLDCGKYLFDTDLDQSLGFFSEACKVQETHKRQLFDKYFATAVKYTLKAQKYTKTIEFLEREIAMYELDPNKGITGIWGCVTGIVLINYTKGQLDAAEIRYDQAVEKYSKLSNDVKQATLCKQFLEVFGKNDQDGLDKIKKSGDLGTLLPSYLATFARSLNILS